MTPRSNADLVRAGFLAQNRGDDDAFTAVLDPDVEWHAGVNPFGFPELLRGVDQVLEVARDARRRFGSLTITLHEIEEAGDDVLVIGTLSGTEGLIMPRAWIWTFRGERAIRIRAFNGAGAARTAWSSDHGPER